VSAIDAIRLVKMQNRELPGDVNLKVRLAPDPRNPRARVTFTRRFF
jgi:hypothetical protein